MCTWEPEWRIVITSGWTIPSLSPGSGKRYFCSQNHADWLWGPPSLLFNGHRSFSPRLKRAGRDVYQSSTWSAEVKNEWSCTSPPPLCRHGVNRDFIFFTFAMYIHIKRRQICHSLMYLHKEPMHIYTNNVHAHTTYAGAHVTFHHTNFECQLEALGLQSHTKNTSAYHRENVGVNTCV
jgi:hypothetical protein